MSRPYSLKKATKNTFAQLKLNPPEKKKLIGKRSILARGKSHVLPTDPFLHPELITLQCIQVTGNDVADR